MNGNFDKEIKEIFLDDIIPNRFQPRLNFDERSLLELAESIKQHGIIQPLVLRRLGDKYEIIAGERRFKASQIAGLTKVPALIADLDDNSSAEVAIVENLHRKEMTALEEAKSFKKLLERGITQEQLGIRLGKSQSYIANKLRLLSLNENVQEALITEKISERHARSLLSIKDSLEQQNLLNEIIAKKMTVKETDEYIKDHFGSSQADELIIPQPEQINKSVNIMDFNLNNVNLEPVVNQPIPTPQIIPEDFLTTHQEEQKINVPRPFIFNNEEIIKKEVAPEPIRGVEVNPQIELINKLNSVDDNSKSNLFSSARDVSQSPYVIPKIDIEDTYIKPQNVFDIDIQKNNAKNINDVPKKNFDINQLLAPDTKEEGSNLLQPDNAVVENKNKFLFNVEDQTTNNKNDIESSKNMIKKVVETIKNTGMIIDYEEFDFERLYQIIIKIEK